MWINEVRWIGWGLTQVLEQGCFSSGKRVLSTWIGQQVGRFVWDCASFAFGRGSTSEWKFTIFWFATTTIGDQGIFCLAVVGNLAQIKCTWIINWTITIGGEKKLRVA